MTSFLLEDPEVVSISYGGLGVYSDRGFTQVGKLGSWGVGELGMWGVGKLGSWEVGELGSWGVE